MVFMQSRGGSVCYAPVDHGLGGLAAAGAHIAEVLLCKGHAAAGQSSLLFHLHLAGQVSAPHGLDVAGVGLSQLLDLLHGGGSPGAGLPVLQGALVQVLAQSLQLCGDSGLQLVQADEHLLAGIAAHQNALVLLQILGADLQAQGHTLHLPLAELPARGVVAVIQLDPCILGDLLGQLGCLLGNTGLVGGNGHYHHLDGGHSRGQDQAVVITMGHDDGAHQTGGHAPAGLVRIVQLVVAAGKGHIVSTAELIPKVVAGAALQGLAVLHHGLDGVGGLCTGKLFLVGLAALQHRDSQILLAGICVAVQLCLGLCLGLCSGLVDGVTLLPPELAAAQERAGGLFPPDHAAPLVILHRQLAVAVQHTGPVVAEHGLAGGAHGQPLLKLVRAAHRDPRHLRREAIDQLAFLFQQAFRDQHRHGHILMAAGLETGVQVFLDILPDRLAVRPQDDKALHAGILHQLCLDADVGVPLCEVLLLAGDRLYKLFVVFCHFVLSSKGRAPDGVSVPHEPILKAPPQRRRIASPVCGALCQRKRGCSALLVALHKVHHIAHRVQGLDGIVRHLNAELILQRHHHVHDIQAVGLKIAHDIAVHRDLRRVDVQLLRQQCADLFKYIHCHGLLFGFGIFLRSQRLGCTLRRCSLFFISQPPPLVKPCF